MTSIIDRTDLIRAIIAAQESAYDESTDDVDVHYDVRFYEFEPEKIRAVEHEHEDGGYVLISRVDPHADADALADSAIAFEEERRELAGARA